jgi:poly-gamma-glutamate synthesis protein (capsule biosynthesis protein)
MPTQTVVAVIGATDVPDRTVTAWAASPGKPGVASARDRLRLIQAVAEAAESADVVAVYLHYGTERVDCPTPDQVSLATTLAEAGADIVAGAHAQLGAGWLGRTYVSYGLGNFVWYHPKSVAEATSGVLTLTVRDGRVVEHQLAPTFTEQDGRPRLVEGDAVDLAIADWHAMQACAGLESAAGMG